MNKELNVRLRATWRLLRAILSLALGILIAARLFQRPPIASVEYAVVLTTVAAVSSLSYFISGFLFTFVAGAFEEIFKFLRSEAVRSPSSSNDDDDPDFDHYQFDKDLARMHGDD